MRIDAGEASVVLTDSPILERVFNTFSALVGAFTTWLCLRFYAPGGDWGDLTLALLAPFLLFFAVAGLWRVLTLPTTTCRVDGTRRVVERTELAPFARRQTRWRFDDIAEMRADARPGYESSWRAAAILRDGRRVILTPHANADRESVDRFVLEARRIMTTA
jgi:hypothetical protein